jgi:hypothetical protein
MEVDAISCMTLRVDRLHLKPIQDLIFIKHGSCHLDESMVLHFGHPILLNSIRGQKLILNAIFI